MADPQARFISNSEVQTFKRCKRKWWLAYHRELKPLVEQVTGIREIGTRIHLALGEVYRPEGITPQEAISLVANGYQLDHARLLEEGRSDEAADLLKDADLADAMITGYFDWTEETGIDQGLEFVASEQTLTYDVGLNDCRSTPVVIRGKLDVVVHREWDDMDLFIDHKTVGTLAVDLWQHEQMITYQSLQQVNGERVVAGVLYNMLRRVKRTKQAKPPFYQRDEVRYNLEQMRSNWRHMMCVIGDILETERRLTDGEDHHDVCPPTFDRSCSYMCDFNVVCGLFDDGSRAEDFLGAYFANYDRDARYSDEESVRAEETK